MTRAEASTIRTAWRDNPQWRKLYVARATSLLGSWLNALALVHLLTHGQAEASGTALALAIVFVLKQLPLSFLGPAAGVLADRFDRRRILIVTELLSVAVALSFLFLEPGGPAIWVYLLAGTQMAITAFFLPAFQALVPALVQPKDLASANVAFAATWSIVFATGSAIGGIMLELFGWRAAIVLDAVSYLVSVLLVLAIKYESPVRAPSTARGIARALGIADLRDGIRYIRGHAEVARLILVKLGWGTMGAITLFLTLLGRTEDYRIGTSPESGVAFLWVSRALGTLFGPLLAHRWARGDPRRLERTLTVAFFVAPTFYVLAAMCTNPWLGGAFVLTAHLGGATLWVISTVLLQRLVPDEFRGRTFAVDVALFMLTASATQLVYAFLIDAQLLELRTTIVVAASICLIPAALWLRRPSAERR
ncbi:MAG: MFS transporter [Planctomycetota bacterium]|nr:MFS transporter [Planctomycetota bacterium]